MARVYPSGFIGPNDGNENSPKTQINVVSQVSGNTSTGVAKVEEVTPPPLKTVQGLYVGMHADTKRLKCFDFREEILKVVLECFYLNNYNTQFNHFLSAQVSCKSLSENHYRFLADMLRLIRGAKPVQPLFYHEKVMCHSQYLKSNSVVIGSNTKQRIENEMREIQNTCTLYIPDVVCLWAEQHNGFYEMLKCMWLMYGDENIETNFEPKK